MKKAKDHFSAQAGLYAKYRPHYPDALYAHLFSLVPSFEMAWDCGTGNGQVALRLAERFDRVVATDISEKQLAMAVRRPNIRYRLSRAEDSGLPDGCAGLITVAQALHWFDFEAFYREVRRVAKPGAVLAVWGYNLLKISPEIDPLVRTFYTQTVGPYWDAERRHVDEEYRNIPFPFPALPAPALFIEAQWDLRDLEGYFNTWSSVQQHIRDTGANPVPSVIEALRAHWKEGATKEIQFPLFLKAGRL